jgi:hypothetical protein
MHHALPAISPTVIGNYKIYAFVLNAACYLVCALYFLIIVL